MTDPERSAGESSDRLFRDDTKFALGRIAVFQYAAVAVFLFLIAGFWVLQIRDHEANSTLAERNRIKTVPMLAPRGKLLDRDGRVIVDNQPAFVVQLTQENLKLEHLPAIAEGLHLDLDDLKATVKRYAAGKRYSPIPIKRDITPAELTFIDSHRDPGTFPELELVQEPRRLYPQNGLAAHVIGYVGEVSEQELNTSDFASYSQGDLVGKSGLERQYNEILKGVDGQRRVVVDVAGREHQVLESTEATPGQNLQLTIDLDLQAVAELALDGKKGAVVALDPRDGSVLAMVSQPAFDPNKFAAHIKAADWKTLTSNPDNPLLNRAIQAQFAPGSTFKPLVAMAGLETGTIDDNFSVSCHGGGTFYGRFFKCWEKRGHGSVNMHAGIIHSCDVYFYTVGNKIGIDGIAEYAEQAGLGKKTGIDLPGEAEGLMPSSKWKLRTQREKWYAGETISVAIGQGAVTVTPIQLASAIGGMANGGVWFKPHLVKMAATADPRRENWNLDNIAKVVSGMYGVVNEGGTGAAAAIPGITVSGKTGSAQRVSNDFKKSGKADDDDKDNGWFVAFAPRENPEIVIAVLLEGGEHGTLAAPTARDIIKAYFDKKSRLSKIATPSLALIQRPGSIMQAVH
jgi:penicillin-binding protein 2